MDDLATMALRDGIDNDARADWAAAGLEAFGEQTGQIRDGDTCDDLEAIIGDFLCDLMHYCDREKLDFNRCLATGQMHHEAEIGEPMDLDDDKEESAP